MLSWTVYLKLLFHLLLPFIPHHHCAHSFLLTHLLLSLHFPRSAFGRNLILITLCFSPRTFLEQDLERCLCSVIILSRGMLSSTCCFCSIRWSAGRHSLILPLLPLSNSPLSTFFLFSCLKMVLNSIFLFSFPFQPLSVFAYSCLQPQKYMC